MWVIDGALGFAPYFGLPFGLFIVPVLLFRRWRLALLAAVPFLMWAAFMVGVNLLLVRSRSCPDGPMLRVATVNVLVGNPEMGALADAVLAQSPDIIVFEELALELEEFSSALAQAYLYRISTETPWVTLVSRIPLKDMRRLPLDPPIPGREPLAAKLSLQGRPVTIVGMHAIPPLNGETYAQHEKQYEVVEFGIQETDGPVIVFGDVNATVYSPSLIGFLRRTGLRPVSSPSQEVTHRPMLGLGIRIDHVLIRGFDACSEEVFDLPGSDHEGLAVGVRLK